MSDVLTDIIKQAVIAAIDEKYNQLKEAEQARALTMELAAEYISCSTQHIRNLVAAGHLSVIRWPSDATKPRPYFDRRDLDKLIEENKRREGHRDHAA
jgi:hypothetical protein